MNTKKRKKKTWITYNYIFFFLSSIIQYKSKFDFQVTLHLTFSQLNLIKRRSGKENKGKFSLFFCYNIENYFFYFQFEPSKYSPGIFSKHLWKKFKKKIQFKHATRINFRATCCKNSFIKKASQTCINDLKQTTEN